VTRLDENAGAAELVLSEQDLAEIAAAASRVPVQGARYSEQMERMTGL
jgi:aryl-alcohol dehydrogenase-like predicted oxidoreductase